METNVETVLKFFSRNSRDIFDPGESWSCRSRKFDAVAIVEVHDVLSQRDQLMDLPTIRTLFTTLIVPVSYIEFDFNTQVRSLSQNRVINLSSFHNIHLIYSALPRGIAKPRTALSDHEMEVFLAERIQTMKEHPRRY